MEQTALIDKAFKKRYDITKDITEWKPTNRAGFPSWIDKTFKYGKKKVSSCPPDALTCASSIKLYPHQEFVKEYLQFNSPYRGMLLYLGLGTGKCHALNTPILMFDGSIKLVQDVIVGDYLMGEDNTPRLVLNLVRGFDKAFQIYNFINEVYTVNSQHILTLYYKPTDTILDLSIQDYLQFPDKTNLFGIKKTVDFRNSLTQPANNISYMAGLNILEIPDISIYKFNNKITRYYFLKGIVDKYGNTIIFENVNIIHDILFIARSIGIKCCKISDNHIFIEDMTIHNVLLSNITLKETYDQEYFGFNLDGNQRYLMGDFTVTHNSCTSIAAAEILHDNMKVYIMTPASLRENYINEMKKCGNMFFNPQQYWTFHPSIKGKTIISEHIDPKIVKKNKGIWIPNPSKASNFNELTSDNREAISAQINAFIEHRFTFINYNGNPRKQLQELAKDGNPFDNSCVIIDEIHNLISRMINSRDVARAIYKLIMNAKNIKLIFLSGTPMLNSPNEIAIILNLLMGYRKEYTSKIPKTLNIKELTKKLEANKYIDTFKIDTTKNTVSYILYPDGFIKSGNLIKKTDKPFSLDIELSKIVIKNIKVIPEDPEEFNKYFISPGGESIQNSDMFMRRILGVVSYFNTFDPKLYPSTKINIVKLLMTETQFSEYEKARLRERRTATKYKKDDSSGVYRFYSRAICNFVYPKEIKRPFAAKLDYLKAEIDDIDYVIKQGSTEEEDSSDAIDYRKQLKTSILELKEKGYLSQKGLSELSPKFLDISKKIKKLNGKALIYSQYRTVEGLGILCNVLEEEGYIEFKVKKIDTTWEIDISEADMKKPKFFQFFGNSEATVILKNIFNGDMEFVPVSIRDKLNKTNIYGENIQIAMITQSGSEGVSLKEVRQVHIVEPYWNNIRVDQVIGRAVRMNSHTALPVSERNVDVYIYNICFTDKQILNSFTIRTRDKSITTDEHLYEISKRKAKLIDSFLELLKKASVDCALNAKYHNNLRCYKFPEESESHKDKLAYELDLSKELIDSQYRKAIKTNQWKGTILETRQGNFLLNPETQQIYDYDIYIESGRLTLLGILKDGKIIMSETKIVSKLDYETDSSSEEAAESSSEEAAESSSSEEEESSDDDSDDEPEIFLKKKKPTSSDKSTRASTGKNSDLVQSSSSVNSTTSSDKSIKLHWRNNSCYMDSLLYILFSRKLEWVQKNLLKIKVTNPISKKIQKELNLIYENKTKYCTDMRKLIQEYDKKYGKGVQELDWLNSQQEPRDFAGFLIRAFDIKSDVKYNIEYSNSSSAKLYFTFNEPLIDYELLTKNKIIKLDMIIPKYNNITYLDADLLIINISRNYLNKKKLLTNVIPLENIELIETKLELIGIIVHHGKSTSGGHYTSMVKDKKSNKWYEYDDMKSSLTKKIDFKKMLTNYVQQNSVAFIYYPPIDTI